VRWLRAASTAGGSTVADQARVALNWAGFTLPAVRLSGGSVVPVVAWTAAARSRWRDGPRPVADRAVLAEWECDGPASAVRVVGFLHLGAPLAGVDRLKAVAGYGPGAVVVGAAGRVGAWTLAEADVAGLSVVEVSRERSARVVVTGREGPVATARRTVATRLREEQLFEWALRVGHEPRHPAAALSGESLVS
jgi:hypothetical protein